ncbi:ribonuclease activity regulator RraA [Paraburkholderia sp. J63]|uniref:ribonuclease activity regulator RraA n=1 Tax=Paraburkholderia sp. J63 TaxID=2805434 RepID=UPI002ABD9C52|nr:ribonuclease activity regulator RraA [Paraburkholderia sp. J63]
MLQALPVRAASRQEPVPLSPKTREILGRVGTANIANALLKRGFRNVCLQGIRPIREGQRMVGPAFTLRFIPAREDLDSLEHYASDDNLHRRAMEDCPEGAVLVIDAFGNTRSSSAGDMMALRLKHRGVRGIVTDGGFRDVPGMLAVGLPAYQREGTQPATPLTMHALELNGPVGCAGVAIYPGDIIVGDSDGLVAIPSHLAEAVALDALESEEYETFAAWHIERGHSLIGMFPASPESRVAYERWLRAGRPPLENQP